MKIFYSDLKMSNEKYISCLYGRIYAASGWILKKNTEKEFSYFLNGCILKYEAFTKSEIEELTDYWYLQPLGVYINENYLPMSEKGIEVLSNYLDTYGIKLSRTITKRSSDILTQIEQNFQNGYVSIIMIDQYNYRVSEKYLNSKDTIHCVLLYGIDTEKKELWVADSPTGGKKTEYKISYDDLAKACTGEMYIIAGANQKKTDSGNICDWSMMKNNQHISRKNVIHFLNGVLSNINSATQNELLGLGCNIDYKIVPHLKASRLIYQDRMYGLIKKLINEWNILKMELFKLALQGNGEGENKVREKARNVIGNILDLEEKLLRETL